MVDCLDDVLLHGLQGGKEKSFLNAIHEAEAADGKMEWQGIELDRTTHATRRAGPFVHDLAEVKEDIVVYFQVLVFTPFIIFLWQVTLYEMNIWSIVKH